MLITSSHIAKLSLSFAYSLSNRLADKATELFKQCEQLNQWKHLGHDLETINIKNQERRLSILEASDLAERMIKLRYELRDALTERNFNLGISTKLAQINEKKEICDLLKLMVKSDKLSIPSDKVVSTLNYIDNPDGEYSFVALDSLTTNQIKERIENLHNEIGEIREEINQLNHTEYLEIYVDKDIIDLMGIKNYK